MSMTIRVALVLALAAACQGDGPTTTSQLTFGTLPPPGDGGGDDDDDDDDTGGLTGAAPTTGAETSGLDPSGPTSDPDTTTAPDTTQGPTTDPDTTQGPTTDPDTTRGPTTEPGTTTDPPVCGDGHADPGELCDGNDFNGLDCTDFGYPAGTLDCDFECGLVSTGCLDALCGDGILQPGEVCDCGGNSCTNDELDSTTCFDLEIPDGGGEHYHGGILKCGADCTQFDESPCEYCGDGELNGQEFCDGADIPYTCEDLGYGGGFLGCTADCEDYNDQACFG